MILKMYHACNSPVPGDDGLKTKAMVFCEDLEDIPDSELDHCFRQARLKRNDSFFPATGEILKAWSLRSEEINRPKDSAAERMKELPPPAPPDMAKDSAEYIANPTPEKLEALREKYPDAGF
jgi:hypothetical protein